MSTQVSQKIKGVIFVFVSIQRTSYEFTALDSDPEVGLVDILLVLAPPYDFLVWVGDFRIFRVTKMFST